MPKEFPFPQGVRMKGGVAFFEEDGGFAAIVHTWDNVECLAEPDEWRSRADHGFWFHRLEMPKKTFSGSSPRGRKLGAEKVYRVNTALRNPRPLDHAHRNQRR